MKVILDGIEIDEIDLSTEAQRLLSEIKSVAAHIHSLENRKRVLQISRERTKQKLINNLISIE